MRRLTRRWRRSEIDADKEAEQDLELYHTCILDDGVGKLGHEETGSVYHGGVMAFKRCMQSQGRI